MTTIKMKNIFSIAKKIGIAKKDLFQYGNFIAKVTANGSKKDSKIILVTAMTPTKAGEGKTTTAIALTDGLNHVLKDQIATCALRQPSMGPVFGVKGGATGGGLASVEPSENININFTGDLHAITAVNNLINAMITNSIYWGNPLDIDPQQILFPRAVDMNDRSLRSIKTEINKKNPNGFREAFVITAASEIMAIFCLAKDEEDFLQMVDNIIIAKNSKGQPITVKELKIENAIRKIIHQALYPNLVQTLYGSPVFVHGGPFANIAHGCCSYRSLTTARSYADYVVTEAGFGSDLGAEKYLDILCSRHPELIPDAIVLVGSLRSMKLQAGVSYEALSQKDVQACLKGLDNYNKHIANLVRYGLPVILCINKFKQDTQEELNAVVKKLKEEHPGLKIVVCDSFNKGVKGAIELAQEVIEETAKSSAFVPLISKEMDVEEKIEIIAKTVYGAKAVEYSDLAKKDLDYIKALGLEHFDVCMAKTPMSLTDDPKILNYVPGFTLHIDRIKISQGAGFLIPISGSILRMPGLPKVPSATKM